MSINTIQTSAQNSNPELYKIRKTTEAQKAEQAENLEALQEVQQQVDEYDKANPVGEEVEGIYSVSHDEEGNVKVEYKQPAKTEAKSDSKTESKPEAGESQQAGAGANIAGTSSSSDDDDDDELEKLKQQRTEIRQQLNSEQDEAVKRQLRTKLQSIEAQILQLSSSLEG